MGNFPSKSSSQLHQSPIASQKRNQSLETVIQNKVISIHVKQTSLKTSFTNTVNAAQTAGAGLCKSPLLSIENSWILRAWS
jgi:hypothetical protein